jgi:hypothetical protein
MTNTVQPLHEKRRRGRPQTQAVKAAAAFFPGIGSRRGRWDKFYMVRAFGVMRDAGLIDETRIMAGEPLPLPICVCYALGTIGDEGLMASLAAEAIERRRAGERAPGTLAYVRLTLRQLAILQEITR